MTQPEPISYMGVAPGTPVQSSSGTEFGRLDKVLQIPEEDLFDGIIVRTSHGERFVDRDQIAEITTAYIRCSLDDAAVADLPPPSGNPVYDVDATEGAGRSVMDVVNRLLRPGHWKRQK